MDWRQLIVCIILIWRETVASGIGDFIVVKTSKGAVQGRSISSKWTNQTFYAFSGIPYASPPTGALRFKDPKPAEPWDKVIDATNGAPSCLQPGSGNSGIPTTLFVKSEDCLYLNVYTPQQLPPEGRLLPVMVWIHGGGFWEGSGSYLRFGPDFLLSEGVVVVTLNYRLGAFGFLTLGTPDAAGNMGLKDQRLALLWVQQEIAQFGGDPENVTLFGESAGSASAHLHYLSPLSEGLFHRVIGESGTGLSYWAVHDVGPSMGQQLAARVNCTSSPLLPCLQEVPADVILEAQNSVNLPTGLGEVIVLLKWVPTVDGQWSNNPFLPDKPEVLAQQRVDSPIPFIMGINSDEGMLALEIDESKLTNITNKLEEFIPKEVHKASSESRIKLLAERLKMFYFKDSSLESTLRGFIDLNTDAMFGYSTAVSARIFRNQTPVYLYYFSFNGTFKRSFSIYLKRKYNFSGVTHGEEMSYLFVRQKINQTAAEYSKEILTWRRVVRMWTNFAKFGTPTIGPDPLLGGVMWHPVGNVSMRFLHIDDQLTMDSSDFQENSVAFWDSITPSRSTILSNSFLMIVVTSLAFILL